jgi:starch synthase
MAAQTRLDVLSREYPPDVYGGAGVHVAELVRALRRRGDLDVLVRCFGADRDEVGTTGYAVPSELEDTNSALRSLGVDLAMAADCAGANVVHSHTWYVGLAGQIASMLHGMPHVYTAHSLEPLRPWKAEQLGGGYTVSSWAERTAIEGAVAVIGVSQAMSDDVLRCYPAVDPARLHVVHNGIDTAEWAPVHAPDRVRELGVDPDRPSVVFVGRVTRQKGLPHLLRAARALPPGVQLVLCAGAPDTPEIGAEVDALVADLRERRGDIGNRGDVVWIGEMLPRPDVVALLTAATVFACPSVYEPLGIVNLEAMACETAVVATATGGIPEVVQHGETGLLVPIEQAADGTGTPLDPATFEADLAAALTEATADPDRTAAMGRAGRARAVREFSWDSVAERTVEVYRAVGAS